MDSLEVNKVCAAVLVAGITFAVAGVIAETLVHPHRLKEAAIKIDVPTEAGAAPATEKPDPPVALLLASADPGAGEALVKQQGCVACHSFTDGGKNGVGPNLWGVVGSPIAEVNGYDFSAALKKHQGPWTYDELYAWLKKPSAFAPGTKMSYAGLADPKKRADIIDYLHTLSKTPEALPVAVPAADAVPAANAPAAVNPPAGKVPEPAK